MRKLILTLITAFVAVSGFAADKAGNPYAKYTEKLPFPMPDVTAPVIPDNQGLRWRW